MGHLVRKVAGAGATIGNLKIQYMRPVRRMVTLRGRFARIGGRTLSFMERTRS